MASVIYTPHPTPGESVLNRVLDLLVSSYSLDTAYAKSLSADAEWRLKAEVGLRDDLFQHHAIGQETCQGGYSWKRRAAAWTNDYFMDNRFDHCPEVQSEGIRGIVCVPLIEEKILIYGALRRPNGLSERRCLQFAETVINTFGRLREGGPERGQPRLPSRDCTPQELNVLFLVSQGFEDEEVADVLSVSASTVRFHLRRLQEKMDCRNRTHLTATALRCGLVP